MVSHRKGKENKIQNLQKNSLKNLFSTEKFHKKIVKYRIKGNTQEVHVKDLEKNLFSLKNHKHKKVSWRFYQ